MPMFSYQLRGLSEVVMTSHLTLPRRLFLTFLGLLWLAAPGPSLLAEDLSNASIIEMTKRGVKEDAIIALIKSETARFSLTDQDRLRLKQARVSAKVIAAMVEASVIKAPRIILDGKPIGGKTLAQAKGGGDLSRVLKGKSVKAKVFLEGAFSEVTTGSTPNLEIELPEGDSIDDYLLVRIDPKGTRREIEVTFVGGTAAVKTVFPLGGLIAGTSVVVRPGLHKLTFASPLPTGEYMLYVLGSADFAKGIYGKGYDFGVRNWID